MTKPSSGNAYVLGHSVVDQNNITRRYVGFCPQNSILYDCLTAKEHMKFYGQLKRGKVSVSEIKYNFFVVPKRLKHFEKTLFCNVDLNFIIWFF